MTSAKSANPASLISKLSAELKKEEAIKPAPWSAFVKSGAHRTRPPHSSDFWFTRSASILRRVYLEGPVGVERLRTYYGGRKKMGHARPHAVLAGGSILRKILQQLDKAGYVTMDRKGGRKITAKGMKFVDNAAKVSK